MGGRCLRSLNNICRTSKECAGGQREVRGEGGRERRREGRGGKDSRKDTIRGTVPLLYFSIGIV